MALTILPYLMTRAMKNADISKDIVILTATSGDTGKAALEGFAKVPHINIVVYYPKDGVSTIQEKQMLTQDGDNTCVIGVAGNFDDTQNGVKEILNNSGLIEELRGQGYVFSSANSINIGRLLPQIVYYFYSYMQLYKKRSSTSAKPSTLWYRLVTSETFWLATMPAPLACPSAGSSARPIKTTS